MNFLAHALLGGEHPDLITGSFVGDFFKGPIPNTLPRRLRLGVKLHRHIDAVSNRLPGIRISVNRYPQPLRRFAPIFLDLLGDHFLARNFDVYWRGDLTRYVSSLYPILKARSALLPRSAVDFIDRIAATRQLQKYAQLEILPPIFSSIEQRFKRPQTGLADAVFQSSKQNYEALEADFHGYFPELQASAVDFLSSTESSNYRPISYLSGRS